MSDHTVSDDDFTIIEPIGTGSFSTVYHAVDKYGRHFALKKLFWNNSPDRIVKELQWIRKLNHENIAKIYAAYRDGDQATLVMGYVPHVPIRALLPQMNGTLLRQYMQGLLRALEYMHKENIIHRDVKPANFLFDPTTGNGCLIDFGLCEENLNIPNQGIPPESPDVEYDLNYPHLLQKKTKMSANRAGTRGFRAPEVLFAYFNQSPLIDIWSAGVVLLSILAQRYPFFKSPDDLTSICEIAAVVGTQRLHDAARECGRRLRFPAERAGVPFPELIRKLNPYFDEMGFPDSAIDLLSKMMEPVPSKRITASAALEHPFFAEE